MLCDEKDRRNEDGKREDQGRRPDAAAAWGEVLRVRAGHLITDSENLRNVPPVDNRTRDTLHPAKLRPSGSGGWSNATGTPP